MEKAQIRYAKKFNIGNYESEEYSIETACESDKTLEGFAELKRLIETAHNNGKTVVIPTTDIVNDQPAPKTKATAKKATETPKVETPKADTPKVEETVEDAPKEEKPKTPRKAASKIINYNRTDIGHKEALKSVLKARKPDYASKANLETATKASTGMVGKPFLGEDGNVLESFVEEFLAYYA